MKILQQLFSFKPSAQAVHGEYYPHIDGIRALAVLPVVLFHILAGLCPGGFAGVDVFFVISGYLITGGILRDLAKDRFTIRNFYYRRIRRIMPAYFAMIIGVFAAGCALYYATPLINLGETVTASTLFMANVHFWNMTGDYFAPQLHSNALLHLWSLSVEEQFYLFIPLLCAFLWKVNRRLVAPVLAVLAVSSLTGAVYTVMIHKQSYAFYLIHLRAWELLAGSLLAMLPAAVCSGPKRNVSSPLKLQLDTLLAATGFLMVIATYIGISSKTPFPGLAAIPPVVGTALLIRYGQSGAVRRVLSWRPFVATGKISYSLYLWHWPVTVFWKYATYDQLYFYDYIGMFLLSFVLGILSWKFVELPVRTSSSWTMRRSFAFAATGTVCLAILGSACAYYQGWPTVLHRRANELAGMPNPLLGGKIQGIIRRIDSVTKAKISCFHEIAQKRDALILQWGSGSCVMGAPDQPKKILLLGDSHAGSLRCGLSTILKEKEVAGYDASQGLAPMYNTKLVASQSALRKLDEFPQVSAVVIAQQWVRYAENWAGNKNTESMYAQLTEFASYVRSKNKTLFIVEDIPNYKYLLNEMVARMQIIQPRKMDPEWERLYQSEEDYHRTQGSINAQLKAICEKTGAVLIPLQLAFKENSRYIYFDEQAIKRTSLYIDSNHLSREGSLRAARFIEPYLFPESDLNK
jgi:peptidoglycan/LPS O-acetylase OafA/YrhL